MSAAVVDPFDVRHARRAAGPLAAFDAAGVLLAADIHPAMALARLAGEDDPDVLLAVALAVRATRVGHVCLDLARVQESVAVDAEAPEDLGALPWPAAERWRDTLARSPLTGADRPLRLVAGRLYLERYWRYEQSVADGLRRRAGAAADVDVDALRDGLARLFGPPGDGVVDLQRIAAAAAVAHRLAVVAGGPGTGKTTTVARIVALLSEQGVVRGGRLPRIALAAPTGKAAARLHESVRDAAVTLDVGAAVRDRLLALEASTVHRLLGRDPSSRSRFRHHGGHPLPHDVVIVDETSMVSLGLLAKLLDALRPEARLVLVGDPNQLTSVEAGNVLSDLVGDQAVGELAVTQAGRDRLAAAVGGPLPPAGAPRVTGLRDAVVTLARVHRFAEHSAIAALADAVQRGDEDAVFRLLDGAGDDVVWVPSGDDEALRAVERAVVGGARAVLDAARRGDARGALAARAEVQVLCALRRGPSGVGAWTRQIERWLGEASSGEVWYAGRPVLVTQNDYQLGLMNGDVGVAVAADDGRLAVAFDDGDGRVRLLAPSRLDAFETVHAMTIHKSQGSQFRRVVVVLPSTASAVATRELLYTAVTRASEQVLLVADRDAVRDALTRRAERASGLGAALAAGS